MRTRQSTSVARAQQLCCVGSEWDVLCRRVPLSHAAAPSFAYRRRTLSKASPPVSATLCRSAPPTALGRSIGRVSWRSGPNMACELDIFSDAHSRGTMLFPPRFDAESSDVGYRQHRGDIPLHRFTSLHCCTSLTRLTFPLCMLQTLSSLATQPTHRL